MRLAIDLAARSPVSNSRKPRVGAVLVRGGTLIGTAFRGELRLGEHAEFTMLHRKLPSSSLASGATLYTTLEPCTSHVHDGLSCAGWIAESNLGRVVIGLLDPNPATCGRGYWQLVEAGLEVEFFPGELASEVRQMVSRFIQVHRHPLRTTLSIAAAVSSHKNPRIATYPDLGWGSVISLLNSPDLRTGWPLDAVTLRLADSERFSMPADRLPVYRRFVEENWERERLYDDQVKFMVLRNPVSSTDSPTLNIDLGATRYTETLFYQQWSSPSVVDEWVHELVRGSLEAKFAHSFVMHAIVISSDDKLLLTRRSAKLSYRAGLWSASCEESLAQFDLENGADEACLAWARRLLHEELGLDGRACGDADMRLLSVFLESELPNVSCCVAIRLRLSAAEVMAKLRSGIRADNEFMEAEFVATDRDSLLEELLNATRDYHPTAPYRLLMALLWLHGELGDDDLEGRAEDPA